MATAAMLAKMVNKSRSVSVNASPENLFRTSITPITRPWTINGTQIRELVRKPKLSSTKEEKRLSW